MRDERPTFATARSVNPIGPPGEDDYLVEGDEQIDQPSAAARVVHTLQIVMIFVLAVLSLAVFWLLGTVLNIL
ncbi:MAG TPA: hypothetical protein VG308_16275 [Stellaceae bacterium]|nr:hypothetical protein [Stellaceae bacterium]